MLEKTKETLKPGNINIIEPSPLKEKKKKGGEGVGVEGRVKKKRKKTQWMFSRRAHAMLCKGG